MEVGYAAVAGVGGGDAGVDESRDWGRGMIVKRGRHFVGGCGKVR